MSEKFTISDFLDIKDKLENAREDDTPFAVQNDGSLSVIGDSNKTEKKMFDYNVKFRYEKDELNSIPENAKQVGKYVMFEIKFDDVHINPRKDLELVESSLGLFPIVNAFSEIAQDKDNKVNELSKKYGIEIEKKIDGKYIPAKENKQLQQELNTLATETNINLIHAYNEAGDEGQDSIYKFVQIMLNIDDEMADHMLPGSVLNVFCATIANHPELFNEAETVFGF